jgi:predicted O-methyltransferase YrrM
MSLAVRPDPESSIWLSPVDGTLCVEILHLLQRGEPHVLEIGVWKGAWSLTVAGNVGNAALFGVDPYPGGEPAQQARARTLDDFTRNGWSDRFRLVESWEQLLAHPQRPDRFDLIHVDGLHTEAACDRDLDEADRVLAEDGVIAVDDYRLLIFPSVGSSLYRFLERRGYRIFMVTEQKAYLARTEHADDWYQRLRDRVHQLDDVVVHEPPPVLRQVLLVDTAPLVLGQHVLVCVPSTSPAGDTPATTRLRAIRLLRDLLPPVAFRALVRLRRRLRRP